MASNRTGHKANATPSPSSSPAKQQTLISRFFAASQPGATAKTDGAPLASPSPVSRKRQREAQPAPVTSPIRIDSVEVVDDDGVVDEVQRVDDEQQEQQEQPAAKRARRSASADTSKLGSLLSAFAQPARTTSSPRKKPPASTAKPTTASPSKTKKEAAPAAEIESDDDDSDANVESDDGDSDHDDDDAPSTKSKASKSRGNANKRSGGRGGSVTPADGVFASWAEALQAGDGFPFTKLEQQVLEVKRAHPDVLLMVEHGYRARFFNQDAEVPTDRPIEPLIHPSRTD